MISTLARLFETCFELPVEALDWRNQHTIGQFIGETHTAVDERARFRVVIDEIRSRRKTEHNDHGGSTAHDGWK